MEAKKIVENMKAVLKRTKRRKPLKHKSENKNVEALNNNEEDKEISELMTKNWQMKTPPVNEKDETENVDVPKEKINAFEKLMSRKSNLDSPSQNQKLSTPPDSDDKRKGKRKNSKRNAVNNIEIVTSSPVNGSINQNEASMIVTTQKLTEKEPSLKKRQRIKGETFENSSKKRKIKDKEMQLDSNENSIDETDIKQVERPKRSCTNKIDYSLFVSPESPEKKSAREKLEAKSITKVPSPAKESKENVKLAPLFTKTSKKPLVESILKEDNAKVEEIKSIEKHVQTSIESARPRRSCAAKTDYSVFDSSLENNSPEKRLLRSIPKVENVNEKSETDTTSVITPNKPVGKIAPVFTAKPKKLSKIFDAEPLNESPIKIVEKDEISQQEPPQLGRPKRSCTGKIDYSQLFNSPEKKSPEKKERKSKKEKDTDVIYIDENSPIKKKGNVKLAPLFMKKIPKPAIDPAVLEARRNFLLSELPANLRAPIEKQRQYEEEILSNDMIAYPKISHITQLMHDNDTLYSHNSKIRINQCDDEDDDLNEKMMIMKLGMMTDCNNKDNDEQDREVRLEPINDIKEAVRNVKDNSGSFPVNRCFKQFLSKLKSAKENDESNENGTSYQNSTFVEIFKPTSFDEILIGSEPVKQLQDFLTSWNDKNGRYENYESDDSCSRQSLKGMNNCCVLSGKNGSGKTLSVYALANDLNYEVIEINAGSKRKGKKILQDLLEATQSHRVEKNFMDDEQSLDNFQNDGADKKTIILVEDAELTFENDDGFVSSIQQLINISKRPVILTTNDSSCQHLQKFIQHNEIIYDCPKNYLTKYLSLICIATSNYQIDENEIEFLYNNNRHDMRKTINEIEFFIRSESANVNSGSLMGLFCGMKNKNKQLQKGCQMAFHSQKDLSTALHSRSSIISDYSAILSCSQQALKDGEISYHQYNLMNEMASFFTESNLLKMEYKNDSAQKDRQHKIISSSISHEICSLNASTRAKNVDFSPLLRHICRSEKNREMSRRTNRSHYLRHHLPTSFNVNEYFNVQCLIFQEDNEV